MPQNPSTQPAPVPPAPAPAPRSSWRELWEVANTALTASDVASLLALLLHVPEPLLFAAVLGAMYALRSPDQP